MVFILKYYSILILNKYFIIVFFIYINMNNTTQNEYNRLSFENVLSIVFVILNLLNIKANQDVKNSLVSGNALPTETMKIYKLIITITVIGYIYFVLRNYSFYKNSTNNSNKSNNPRIQYIRLIGSILILIGGLLLMYTVFNDSNDVDSGDVEV